MLESAISHISAAITKDLPKSYIASFDGISDGDVYLDKIDIDGGGAHRRIRFVFHTGKGIGLDYARRPGRAAV